MMIREEFLVERQGKKFVLYAGLLDAAHGQGIRAIRTTLIQVPGDENANVAIVSATVELGDKTFTGLGDASPLNVARPMLTCLIRLAETRAKARALRDAINVGVAALEELDSDDDEPKAQRASAPAHRAQASSPTPIRPAAPPAQAARAAAPQRPAANVAAPWLVTSKRIGDPWLCCVIEKGHRCTRHLEPITKPNGGTWTPDQLIETAQAEGLRPGIVLCIEHLKEARQKNCFSRIALTPAEAEAAAVGDI